MPIKVNGEIVPDEAVEFELKQLVKFYTDHMSPEEVIKQIGALRNKAVHQAIGAKLLLMESARLDLKVTQEEIEAKLRQMVENSGGRENFDGILRRQGLNEDSVREGIERGKKVDKLVEQVTGGLSDPTEKEIEEHFKMHAAEYGRPEMVQAQHILIKPASDSMKDRETARSKLMEIRRKIDEGRNFSDMAAGYSECPSGKKAGGSLGWFAHGMMIPEFDKAVFSMDVGEISDIIETPVGYHIVHNTGHDEGGEVTVADVHDKVRDFLRHVRRGQALSAFVEELRAKAVIEEVGGGEDGRE